VDILRALHDHGIANMYATRESKKKVKRGKEGEEVGRQMPSCHFQYLFL